MAAALAGANMIYGLGMVELGMTMDFGLLVADNEFVRMIRRMLDRSSTVNRQIELI